MANHKENLAQWLMIKALIKNGDVRELEKIADKMIRELEDHRDTKSGDKQ